jgi:hypothetical protein
MRAIFLILIVAVIAAIVAIQTGLVDISQTRPAKLPGVSAEGGAITATHGQTPKFEVETGSVGVGTRDATVPVPTVKIEQRPGTVQVPAIKVRPPQGDAPANQAAPAQ